jgi:hypothetical protein
MSRYLLLLPIAVALVGTAFGQETATIIPIVNPGFEDDVLSCGAGFDCDASPLTGWLCGPDAGVFKPSTAQFPNGIPQGTNVAYLGRGLNTVQTGSILQQVGATVKANTTYTLKLSVGARADVGFCGVHRLLRGAPGGKCDPGLRQHPDSSAWHLPDRRNRVSVGRGASAVGAAFANSGEECWHWTG